MQTIGRQQNIQFLFPTVYYTPYIQRNEKETNLCPYAV
jgi:hypothetical protein